MQLESHFKMTSSTSNLSAEAAVFVPSFAVPGAGDSELVTQQSTVPAVSACIEQAVHLLMCNPEDFYEVANYLTTQLAEMIQDDDSLTVLVDKLVDQGIIVPHFQYSIARLCTFLCHNLPVGVEKSFRAGLLGRCQQEFDHKCDLIKTVEGCSTLVRLTLFFGEMMLQMKLSDGQTIPLFPGKVIELLLCLLSVTSDDSVRGIVQTIKLTGSMLQTQVPQDFSKLMKLLKDKLVDEEKKLSSSQRRMLLNIVEIHASSYSDTVNAGSTINATTSDAQQVTVSTNNVVAGVAAPEASDNPEAYFSGSSDEEVIDGIMVRYNEGDFEIINEEGVQYVVPCDMDPEMEDAYESFMSGTKS